MSGTASAGVHLAADVYRTSRLKGRRRLNAVPELVSDAGSVYTHATGNTLPGSAGAGVVSAGVSLYNSSKVKAHGTRERVGKRAGQAQAAAGVVEAGATAVGSEAVASAAGGVGNIITLAYNTYVGVTADGSTTAGRTEREVAAGAIIGTIIYPGIGTIVGAVVGYAAASLSGGKQTEHHGVNSVSGHRAIVTGFVAAERWDDADAATWSFFQAGQGTDGEKRSFQPGMPAVLPNGKRNTSFIARHGHQSVNVRPVQVKLADGSYVMFPGSGTGIRVEADPDGAPIVHDPLNRFGQSARAAAAGFLILGAALVAFLLWLVLRAKE